MSGSDGNGSANGTVTGSAGASRRRATRITSWWTKLAENYNKAFTWGIRIAVGVGVILIVVVLLVCYMNLGKAFKHALSTEVAVLGCVGSLLQAIKAKHREESLEGAGPGGFDEKGHSAFVKKAWLIVFWSALLTLVAEIIDFWVDWPELYRPLWLYLQSK